MSDAGNLAQGEEEATGVLCYAWSWLTRKLLHKEACGFEHSYSPVAD